MRKKRLKFGFIFVIARNQKEKLKNAQDDFVATQKRIYEYQESLREQFAQTADAKAEQKLVEWFVFNYSFYEDKVGKEKELFPILMRYEICE